MYPRNGIEGTHSELVRGHGLRQTKYRGLSRVSLSHYFMAAACNVKRYLKRLAFQIEMATLTPCMRVRFNLDFLPLPQAAMTIIRGQNLQPPIKSKFAIGFFSRIFSEEVEPQSFGSVGLERFRSKVPNGRWPALRADSRINSRKTPALAIALAGRDQSTLRGRAGI